MVLGRENDEKYSIPTRRCQVSHCRKKIPYYDTFCEDHEGYSARKYNNGVRNNKQNKRYAQFYNGKEWKTARRYKIMDSPLCEICLEKGKRTPAVIVHHLVEIRTDSGWRRRLDKSNLQSVCRECHNTIHKKEW